MRAFANTLLARLLIGSAIPLVLFAVVVLVSGIVIARLLDALRKEKRSHEVLSQALLLSQDLERLRAAIDTAPPGAAARSPRVESAGDRVARRGRKLVDLATDDPAQQEAAEAILARQTELFGLVKRGRPPGEVAPVLDDVTDRLERFARREEEVLEERQQRAEEQARRSYPVIAVTVALALVFTLVGSLSAARGVTGPVRRLRRAVAELVAGRFRSVPPGGPAEVADLIVFFNHMALTLSQRTSLLEQQEERYRTYIGAISQILWTTDAAGSVVGDLPTWRAYTGQSEQDVKGAGWLEAVHPEDRDRVRRDWQQAVETRGLFEVECRLRSASGEYRPFACTGAPIITTDGGVREWVGTCRDITEERERQALAQARDAAEASSRAKSEFLTRMSHELRTPLNAVIGMSRMLATQRFGALNAKQDDYIADITRAGEHLLALINDILDLSKVEAGKMEVQPDSFALAGAIEALASTLRPLADARRLALTLVPPAEDGTVQTDPGRFRQVLYNLLSNAIKFTRTGGRVTVSWEWVADPALDAAAVPQAAATAFRVRVADTGVGIAPGEQEAIWDEFRQGRPPVDETQPGTGLGLALTRRLVGLLGGTIGLSSAPGQGSTFTFVLPRLRCAAATR